MRVFSDRLIALVFAVGMLVGGIGIGHAGPYEDALAGFTTDEFSDTADSVTAVATSGSPLAPALIAALQDGRLLFSAKDKKVFIKTADDKLLDAETGKPFEGTPPDDVDAVRVNNRLRGVIGAANGALTLMAPNANVRYDAAQSVFKSREASVLPAVEKALEAEKNAKVKKALTEARAAITLTAEDSSEADKVAAIGVVSARGDQDSLSLIEGLPANQPPAVVAAAKAASAKIQRTLALWNTVQNLWYGLSLGSVLLLAAIGLAITFGVM